MIDKLRNLFGTPVGSDESSSKEAKNEVSEEAFETPDMDEVLRENQTADELQNRTTELTSTIGDVAKQIW